MEKEYVVVVNRGINLEEFDAELSASSGSGPIPNRSVDVANARIGSKRMTHWMLTDDEATALAEDPRVFCVEIPADQRDDISIGLNSRQTGTFYRGSNLSSDYVNWGLRRCTATDNSAFGFQTTLTGDYDYALDGTGVDVVIQDSGIQADHPEFNDAAGNSRVQQINWYTASGISGTQSANHYRDADGHGTHVAGIAAGKTYGWAKGARIYSQKLEGLETLGGTDSTGIPLASSFDSIRLWHAAKAGSRPTVVNMSWGYGIDQGGNPTSGNYRGTAWTWGSTYTDRYVLWAAVGIPTAVIAAGVKIPIRVGSVDAEIEDMIDAGIHVVIAAGNTPMKADVINGADYNNTTVFGGVTYNYHRGSSPFSENALMVGNIDSSVQSSGGQFYDKTATSSTRGPGVNIWAPGGGVVSAASNIGDASYTTIDYPDDANFKIMNISGTSMAAPQVAGLIALKLQSVPTKRPGPMKADIINEAKSVVYNTSSSTDYENLNQSLMGSEPNILFSKFASYNPMSFTGPLTIRNVGPTLR
jgi:subtilisin family serine protease